MDTKCIAVKVGKPLWKAITIAAMEAETSVQSLVGGVLEREFSEERVDLKRRADGLRKKLDEAVKVAPVAVPEAPKAVVEKPDQSTCKHKFTKYTGRGCVHCGWEPPIV